MKAPQEASNPEEALRYFAQTLLSGPFEEAALLERAAALVGAQRRWVRACVRRLVIACDGTTRPTLPWMISRLADDPGFAQYWEAIRFRGLNKISLRNYRYSWRGKRSGAARLIEAPKPRLKSLQRKVLHGILDGIPPHEAAHGFRRGGSVGSFTAPHVGKPIVLRMDREDFFASVRGSQDLPHAARRSPIRSRRGAQRAAKHAAPGIRAVEGRAPSLRPRRIRAAGRVDARSVSRAISRENRLGGFVESNSRRAAAAAN